MWENVVLYLKAEEPNGVDDVVLSGGTDGRQHQGHVVHPEAEEEQEAQQMAPDIHGFIGQNEKAAQKNYTFSLKKPPIMLIHIQTWTWRISIPY